MTPAARRLLALLIVLAATPLRAGTAATLRTYHCSIELLPGNRARVVAKVVIDGAVAGSSLEFTRICYPGQAVSGFQSGAGAIEGPLQRYRIEVAESTCSRDFEYFVEPAATDGVARIPLVVPGPPAEPGARAVELDIHLGSGMVPAGDTFPGFIWSEANVGKTLLSNVPTFVRVSARPAAEASSMRDLLGNATFLNDAAIVLFLIAGSVFWWARNRGQ